MPRTIRTKVYKFNELSKDAQFKALSDHINFEIEMQLKPVVFYLDNENKPHYHIKSRHGWISRYEKGNKGVYCSWYA